MFAGYLQKLSDGLAVTEEQAKLIVASMQDFYKSTGIFQRIAKSNYFENFTLFIIGVTGPRCICAPESHLSFTHQALVAPLDTVLSLLRGQLWRESCIRPRAKLEGIVSAEVFVPALHTDSEVV